MQNAHTDKACIKVVFPALFPPTRSVKPFGFKLKVCDLYFLNRVSSIFLIILLLSPSTNSYCFSINLSVLIIKL